jgi:hypothetical protein
MQQGRCRLSLSCLEAVPIYIAACAGASRIEAAPPRQCSDAAEQRRPQKHVAELEVAWPQSPLSGAAPRSKGPSPGPGPRARCPSRRAGEHGLLHNEASRGLATPEERMRDQKKLGTTSVAPAPSPPQGPSAGRSGASTCASVHWIVAVRGDRAHTVVP